MNVTVSGSTSLTDEQRGGIVTRMGTGVVEDLTTENYKNVYQHDKNKRLSVAEIQTALKEYGLGITFPPNNAFDVFYDYNDELSDENFIEFNLWFNNKESDLTLSLTIYKTGDYSIEDIHVL